MAVLESKLRSKRILSNTTRFARILSAVFFLHNRQCCLRCTNHSNTSLRTLLLEMYVLYTIDNNDNSNNTAAKYNLTS